MTSNPGDHDGAAPASPPPWYSERKLDVDGVRRAIGRSCPEVEAREVAYLHAGWDSEAFLVDGEWVFRFPKRRSVVRHLEAEIAVLPLIAPSLPLPVPEFRFVGAPGPEFPFPFAGYRRLPGIGADTLVDAGADVTALLPVLIEFLACLHSQPIVGPIARLSGYPLDARADILARASALGLAQEPLFRRASEWLTEHPLPPTERRVLLHADLGAEHILIEPDGSRVLGIIDWGDMDLGDPASDLAALVNLAGLHAFRAALADSSYPRDPTLVERAAVIALRTLLVHWCDFVEWNDPDGERAARTWLTRALDSE